MSGHKILITFNLITTYSFKCGLFLVKVYLGLFNHSLFSISHYQYNSKTNQSCGTTIGHKLTSTQHTETILSILASLLSSVISLIETILCNILYFCFNIPFQFKF